MTQHKLGSHRLNKCWVCALLDPTYDWVIRSATPGVILTSTPLHQRIAAAPVVHDLRTPPACLPTSRAGAARRPDLAPLGALIAEPQVRDLLAGIFGASPYLTELIERNPASLQRGACRRSRSSASPPWSAR